MSDNHQLVPAPEMALEKSDMHPLVSAAMKGGVLDPTTLERLMDLQERWEKQKAAKAFTRAMVSLKRDMPSIIGHDKEVDYTAKTGGRVRYSFTRLATAIEQITPHLSNYGLSLNWIPKTSDGMVHVTSRLTHINGHQEETTMSGPPDNSGKKNPLQAIGSTQSYLERYGGLALLGVVTKDMPDADIPMPEGGAVDADKNLKAVAWMARQGVSVEKAMEHVGRPVNEWTDEDLTTLREWVRQPPSPPPEPEPEERPVVTNPKSPPKEQVAEIFAQAERVYGAGFMGPLGRQCRACQSGGFAIGEMDKAQANWLLDDLTNRPDCKETK